VLGFTDTAQGLAPTFTCDISNENAGNMQTDVIKIIKRHVILDCIICVGKYDIK